MDVTRTLETEIAALEAVGLIYVSDAEPGIRRLRKGKGFCYRLPDGTLVCDGPEKQRIQSLGCRRPTRMSGSALTRTDICRQPASMRVAASNTGIIPPGSSFAAN